MRLTAVLLAAVVLGACSQPNGDSADARRPAVTTSSSTTTTAPPPPTLPQPARYAPLLGEPALDVKQVAADVVQALTTYAAGEGNPAAARQRLATLQAAPEVADAAAPLLAPGAASLGEIVYPQLGGLVGQQASVMVVVRQRLLEGGAERAVTRTIDVRLDSSSGGWRVTELASLGGEPAATPAPLPPVAAEVLNSDRIELPDSARWDIEAGRIDVRVLELLARLARDRSLAVTTLASGHPYNVFGIDKVSNHIVGRAVDIWAVDGVPVLEQRDPAGPLFALVTQLLAEGVTELGSPWDLGDPIGASFTNTVHQDHLHLGYDA